MTSTSPFPLELSHELDHQRYHQLLSLKTQASSSCSSPPYSVLFNPVPDYQQKEADIHHGSWDYPTLKNESDSGPKLSIWKKEDRSNEVHGDNSSVKWMSSKMRLMRKTTNVDQAAAMDVPSHSIQKLEDQKGSSSPLQTDNSSNSSYSISNNNNNNTVRVCTDCNTTKTPLWRSGPRGPKSLCNACGIRQRKARRAMAAAAAAANGTNTILATDKASGNNTKVQQKEKKSSNSRLPFKKRCKLTSSQPRGRKKLCFEDLPIILSKNSAFQQVFPQDEKEAAILLMALSYGLVHG